MFSAGGVFSSDPAAAQNSLSDTFVAARDASNAIWVNAFAAALQAWNGWVAAGAVAQGTPAISVSTNGSAYVAMRDSFNSYWVRSYGIGSGFGAWTPLGGVFITDPVTAAGLDGSIYIIGKDSGNAIWSGSVSVGVDGAASVAGRDFSNGNWMGRVQGNTWTGWSFGGGVSNTDPVNARVGNRSYTIFLDGSGAVWYRPFLEGFGNGWESSWASSGGVLQTIAPAGSGPDLYVVGQDPSNAV